MKYLPKDFDMDKMNAMKFLYIYRRKQEIASQLLSEVDLSSYDDFVAKKPFIKSYEYIQQETGMSDADLSEAIHIGMWIDEYDKMINMTDQERQSYVDSLEEEYEIPEDLQNELEELHDDISNMIQKKQKERDLFKQICDDYFNAED
jgi:hypothetical protein